MRDFALDEWPLGEGTPFPVVRDPAGLVYFDRGPRTLADVWLAARELGDRPAIRYRDEVWTYQDADRAVRAFARALRRELGVAPGDRVAIAMRNYPEWVITFWACQTIGAVVVAFNAWFGASELEYLCSDSRPKVVVADEERVALLRTTNWSVQLVGVRCGDLRPEERSFEDLSRPGAEPPSVDPAVRVDPHWPATILYTSGTTSRAKGVVSTHRNHVTNMLQLQVRGARGAAAPSSAARAGASPPPVLDVYPLFHIAGLTLVYSAALGGACLVLMYKWDVDAACSLIAEHSVTGFSGPPLMVRELLDRLEEDPDALPSLASIGFGGSSAPVSQVVEIAKLHGGAVAPVTGYGLTETTSTVVALSGDEFVKRPTSIGTPLPLVRTRIVGPDGACVDPGTEGELVIQGAQVAVGYLDRPADTDVAFRDGWFHTGDLVREDADGYLYIVGRIKDIVIRGSENISCGEVEGVIGAHRDVAEVGVVGTPHPRLGEEVCAVVRLKPGRRATADELRRFSAGTLAAFKVPRHVLIVEEPLPRNASGKVVKLDLRAWCVRLIAAGSRAD